jgi:hypothetical protein
MALGDCAACGVMPIHAVAATVAPPAEKVVPSQPGAPKHWPSLRRRERQQRGGEPRDVDTADKERHQVCVVGVV